MKITIEIPDDELMTIIRTAIREELVSLAKINTDQVQSPLTISRQEAADKIGVAISKIDRLIKSGQLKSVKLGRNIRLRVVDIEEFIKSK